MLGGVQLTVTIRDDLYQQIQRRACEEHRPVADVVNDVVEAGIASYTSRRQRTLGAFQGQITGSNDFDNELADFGDATAEQVST